MKHTYRRIPPFILITLSLCFPANALAKELGNQSDSVFRFQHKLAENGSTQAQYKLAMMYEAGIGVDKDIDQARHWYSQAAEAGNKSATDRMTFLTVKQQGYQKEKHEPWFQGIKQDASENKPEAMIILGQMYRNGIAVNKDLEKSLELLTTVNSSGVVNVEREMLAVRNEIAASKQARAEARKKHDPVVATTRQANIEPARKPLDEKALAARKEAEAARKAAEEKKLLAEKKRRYEKVMEQIRLEQKLIDQQQARVAGGATAAVDDEF